MDPLKIPNTHKRTHRYKQTNKQQNEQTHISTNTNFTREADDKILKLISVNLNYLISFTTDYR